MSKLHILNTRSAGGHVFNGMFGSITPSPKGDNVVQFKIDPALSKCSNLLSDSSMPGGLHVMAEEVVTVEAEAHIIDAIKATLARGLQAKWDRHYQSFLGPMVARADGEDSEHAATLTAIPGMGSVPASVLRQALKAEREVASRGMDNLIRDLPGVAPHWVNVALKGAWVGYNAEGTERTCSGTSQISLTDDLNPTAIEQWGNFQHAEYEATKAIAQPQAQEAIDAQEHLTDGWFDLNAAIPVYLPVQANVAPAQSSAFGRLFSFGSRPEMAPRPQVADMSEVARSVMSIIMETPILKSLVVDSPAAVAPDYQSCVVTEVRSPIDTYSDDIDDEDDEDEDDQYDDEGYRERDRG